VISSRVPKISRNKRKSDGGPRNTTCVMGRFTG
jgi:hypothetical protein